MLPTPLRGYWGKAAASLHTILRDSVCSRGLRLPPHPRFPAIGFLLHTLLVNLLQTGITIEDPLQTPQDLAKLGVSAQQKPYDV